MNETTPGQVGVSRPKVTLMMILCGIVGAVSIGAVNAATTDEDVPTVTVRYSPSSLETDQGARRCTGGSSTPPSKSARNTAATRTLSPMWCGIAANRRSRTPCSRSITRDLVAVHATNAKNG